MATTATAPADLARAVFDAFNAHDVDAMRALWADDVVERFPDETLRGADALAASMRDLFTALPDARMDIQALAEDGETVMVRWRLTGTHRGPFKGVNATGETVTIDGTDHFTFRDGKQVENYVIFDRMQFAQQLGMLPPDGSRQELGMRRLFNARTALRARLRRGR